MPSCVAIYTIGLYFVSDTRTCLFMYMTYVCVCVCVRGVAIPRVLRPASPSLCVSVRVSLWGCGFICVCVCERESVWGGGSIWALLLISFHLHLADAFIQSDLHMCDLQCIHILHLH